MSERRNNDDDHQRIKKAISKGQRTGRPRKQDTSTPIDNSLWFQDQKAIQIVQLLGNRGQILFKCLSGPTQSNSFLQQIKGERQKFSEFLQANQEILLQILLKNNYKSNIKYFFIGKNKTKFQDQNNPIIHPDFINSFLLILKISRENNQADVQFNYENHQHLVTWALITEWSKSGRELLNELQRPSTNDFDKIKQCIEEEKTKNKYRELEKKNIEQLLQEPELANYELEINSLIDSLQEYMRHL